MAYVRTLGNQLALVHGERDPETRKVRQRTLFTLYSRPEARAAMGDQAGVWQSLLRYRYPLIKFDWERIHAGIEERLDVLPETYSYEADEILGGFRQDLCTLVRTLGLADPQTTLTAADLLSGHRIELEYLRDLIDWRLQLCEQEASEWNGDNAFFWRHRTQPGGVTSEVMETISEAYDRRELDRVEALAQLFIDSYEDYAEGHNYLGLVALDREQPKDAIPHFERAMEVGRRLFPKRLAKKHYWRDHHTRPYIRGMRNMTHALLRTRRFEEALALCDRLEQECADTDAATTFRASIFLNTRRWQEAREAAARLSGIWPEHSYIVAFASFELSRTDEALARFLHAAINRPRTGRMALGLRMMGEPSDYQQVTDHNAGIEFVRDHAAFLGSQSRKARKFFEDIARSKRLEEILAELDEAIELWHSKVQPTSKQGYTRMMRMRTLEYAVEVAPEVEA